MEFVACVGPEESGELGTKIDKIKIDTFHKIAVKTEIY